MKWYVDYMVVVRLICDIQIILSGIKFNSKKINNSPLSKDCGRGSEGFRMNKKKEYYNFCGLSMRPRAPAGIAFIYI